MPIRGILFEGCCAGAIVDPRAAAANAARRARRLIRSPARNAMAFPPKGSEEIRASLSRAAHRGRAGRQEPVEYMARPLGERAILRAVEDLYPVDEDPVDADGDADRPGAAAG